MTEFSDRDVERAIQINGSGRDERLAEPRRVVLFIAAAGTVSGRLMYALEREFPWVVVEQAENIGAACAAFDHPVSLILVDAPLMKAVEHASPGANAPAPAGALGRD